MHKTEKPSIIYSSWKYLNYDTIFLLVNKVKFFRFSKKRMFVLAQCAKRPFLNAFLSAIVFQSRTKQLKTVKGCYLCAGDKGDAFPASSWYFSAPGSTDFYRYVAAILHCISKSNG